MDRLKRYPAKISPVQFQSEFSEDYCKSEDVAKLESTVHDMRSILEYWRDFVIEGGSMEELKTLFPADVDKVLEKAK